MKKMIFAALAIAAMMVSCQKEALVDNQKETPAEEKNELQPVVLGSNLFKAAATKASVNDMHTWKADGKKIYVYALNNNELAENKVFIDNVGAMLSGDYADQNTYTGSLDLKNPLNNNNPFYYGTSDDDIYDFYAYYLGYDPEGEDSVTAGLVSDVITVADVKVKGDNDIMIASTNKAADAIVEGAMVNPKYLYSQYSARHNVKPNLVFKHMLSKFSFNVRYAGHLAADSKIELTGIKFVGAKNSGTLFLNGDAPGFEAGDATSAIILKNLNGPVQLLNEEAENNGYQNVGNLMVVPAASDTLVIEFKQTFNLSQEGDPEVEPFDLKKVITPQDVVDENGQHPTAEAFEAGKHYVVNITVYGLEAVVVNVQLVRWEDAGTITIDPDQKEDGIMKQVNATVTIDANNKNCVLYAETFEAEEDIYCVFTGEGEDGKLVPAPVGEYTVADSGEDPALAAGTTIQVNEAGIIYSVTPASE